MFWAVWAAIGWRDDEPWQLTALRLFVSMGSAGAAVLGYRNRFAPWGHGAGSMTREQWNERQRQKAVDRERGRG